MQARILFPHPPDKGNLLWRKSELPGHESELLQSLNKLSKLGYWASAYPEGDGVCFSVKSEQSEGQMLLDFVQSFPWLVIESGRLGSSNLELAELEELGGGNADIDCIVMVPLERVHFESTFDIGPFKFVCAEQFQSQVDDRLADMSGAYIQFKTRLRYADMLRVGRFVQDGDVVIDKCLSVAEHVMDIIRFEFSSFAKPHFTPNPVGQLENGFYAVEIIPCGKSHLRPMNLGGIARPMSASNNWLGPEIEDLPFRSRDYLIEILNGRSDELALSVKSALRGCRQSFYGLGDESRFLNLVFTLDGLAHPERTWSGWKHRTYIAALVSGGDINEFALVLKSYKALYEIRNALVHKGKDFYEMGASPMKSCEDLYDYVRSVIHLIAERDLTTVTELHQLAKSWLSQSTWKSRYQSEIISMSVSNDKLHQIQIPIW